MSKSILALLSLSILVAISRCCGNLPTGGKLETPTVMSTITAEAVTPTSTPARQPSPTTTLTSPTTPTLAPSSLPSPWSATPTPSPTVEATSPSEPTGPAVATPFQGFGIDYCGPNLAECAALGATWSCYSGIRTLADAQAALDLAQSLNMKLVLRLPVGDWGWNGNQFVNLTYLREFEPIFNHPALLGFYGLHEPWERFNAQQLQEFYSQWKAVAPSLPIWHDMDYLLPEFTDGICDYCIVTAHSHFRDRDGNPVSDYNYRTRPILEMSQANIQADPDAVLCVELQVFGNDEGEYRMPTADEARENAAIVLDEFGVTCITWYAYYHDAYDHVLGDADQAPLREAVRQIGERYFRP